MEQEAGHAKGNAMRLIKGAASCSTKKVLLVNSILQILKIQMGPKPMEMEEAEMKSVNSIYKIPRARPWAPGAWGPVGGLAGAGIPQNSQKKLKKKGRGGAGGAGAAQPRGCRGPKSLENWKIRIPARGLGLQLRRARGPTSWFYFQKWGRKSSFSRAPNGQHGGQAQGNKIPN